MNNIAKIIQAFITVVILLVSLSACSEDYIPLGEYRIEWDDFDPKLHGQVVRFNVPMSYVLLEDSHIGDYIREDVEIGRVLLSEDSVIGPGGAIRRGYLTQQVDDGMAFTIKASYWHRRDWFERELSGDMRRLVLIDGTGIESTTLFSTLLLYSDKPELDKYSEEGRFK